MNIFASVLQQAAQPPQAQQGDYTGPDGFLYCGQCNTPKEMFAPKEIQDLIFPGQPPHKVKIPCKCQQQQQQQQEQQQKQQAKLQTIQQLTQSLIEIQAAQQPLATFQQNDGRSPKNTNQLARYVKNFDQIYNENIGLMLYGPPGNGKTFFAECIANALLQDGQFAIFSSIPFLAAAISANYGANRQFILKNIETCDLLILDDFGAERDTSYMQEQAYEIINTRYNAPRYIKGQQQPLKGLPLIITTNLTPQDFTAQNGLQDKRIFERVREMCSPILIEGETRRKAISSSKIQALKSILEGSD